MMEEEDLERKHEQIHVCLEPNVSKTGEKQLLKGGKIFASVALWETLDTNFLSK